MLAFNVLCDWKSKINKKSILISSFNSKKKLFQINLKKKLKIILCSTGKLPSSMEENTFLLWVWTWRKNLHILFLTGRYCRLNKYGNEKLVDMEYQIYIFDFITFFSMVWSISCWYCAWKRRGGVKSSCKFLLKLRIYLTFNSNILPDL